MASNKSTNKKQTPAVEESDLPKTLGRILCGEREKQGLSIEEVSKVLRIRPGLIRELEEDDYRNFSHASYARLSLLAYGRYLRISEEEIRPWLPENRHLDTEGLQYLDHIADPVSPTTSRRDYGARRPVRSRRGLQGWIWGFAAILLLMVLWYAYVFIRNVERVRATGTVPEELQIVEEVDDSDEPTAAPEEGPVRFDERAWEEHFEMDREFIRGFETPMVGEEGWYSPVEAVEEGEGAAPRVLPALPALPVEEEDAQAPEEEPEAP